MMAFNPTDTSKSDNLVVEFDVYHSWVADKVDVFCCPSSEVKLTHVVAGLVVSAYEHGQNRRNFLACVVRMERAHAPVFDGARHGLEVQFCSHRLEVTTTEHQINLLRVLILPLNQLRVHFVELTMKTTNHSYFKMRHFK